MSLAGKVAIVTGSGRNIGKSIAATLVREQMKVVIVTSHAESARAAQQVIGGESIAIACDVSKESDVRAMVDETIKTYGAIDVLVNNAGNIVKKGLIETSVEEFDSVLDINLRGTFLCSKYVAEKMIARGQGGRIINLTSGVVFRHIPGFSAYVAAKAGVWALTAQMALELATHDIRVNAIAPGIVGDQTGGGTEQTARNAEAVPLKRVGNASDVAELVRYLISEQAGYITGVTIPVDGGFVL